MTWSLKEIYKALNLKNELNQNFIFENLSINSRNISSKSLFIPLKGKNFDGHNFIDDAARKGVRFSLVEKKKKKLVKDRKIKLIEVKNTYESLKELAIYARNNVSNLKVICITGSSGKTTLKEWLKKILSKNYMVYSNPGNFNNYIGMPLTLMNIPKKLKYVF